MALAPLAPRDASADPLTRAEVARAVLMAGGVETTYTRVGTGATVLLLRADDGGDAPSTLLTALARRFRVIAPVPPTAPAGCSDDAFAAWLRDLLDGLGIDGATIVAEGALAPPALAFALSDPFRVHRLALVLADPAAAAVAAAPRLGAFGVGIATSAGRVAAGAAGAVSRRCDDVLDFLSDDLGHARDGEAAVGD